MGGGPAAGPFGSANVEAPTADQAAEFDRFAIQGRGVPEAALMENAGRQAALLIHHLFPGRRIVGLVGAGNNGGDALVCLRALAAWGYTVEGIIVADRREDFLLHGWSLPVVTDSEVEGILRERLRGAVVVDGILGTGIKGAPRPRQAGVIDALNGAEEATVVSLDTPSGVDGNTGFVPGRAVDADVTVAFGWPKLGTLLRPGRQRAGRLIAVEIGFPPPEELGWARLVTPAWARDHLPDRVPDTHKNEVGALCLVAGSQMAGAAILAARSAFRAGAGLVRVCCGRDSRDAVLSSCPEALWVDAGDRDRLADAVVSSRAVAVGPGLGTGDESRGQLATVLGALDGQGLVVDADALTLLADSPGVEARGGVVVTPHPGEMGRLSGLDTAAVQKDRVGAARRLADSRGWVTLLKGAPSLVATPDGGLMVEVQGSSDLAVAGMGDVLTGAVGGLVAQGLDVATAAAVALHVTGRAARIVSLGPSLTPSDVIEAIPGALLEEPATPSRLPFPFVTFDQPLPG